MNTIKTIRVVDYIGNQLCVSADDAQKLHDKIISFLSKGEAVTVSFENSILIISLFLNVAIGQLYNAFNEKEIGSLLSVEGLSDDDVELLQRVIDNAKKYYSNQKGYDDAWKIEEDDYEE